MKRSFIIFLSLVRDQRIHRELDGATCNEKIYQEVSKRMAAHRYSRTIKQCREKLKKLKSDYRSIKDHNGRSGSNRRCWKWFSQMDAIYRHRPASNGRESGLDSAAALFETMFEDGECSVTSRNFYITYPIGGKLTLNKQVYFESNVIVSCMQIMS